MIHDLVLVIDKNILPAATHSMHRALQASSIIISQRLMPTECPRIVLSIEFSCNGNWPEDRDL